MSNSLYVVWDDPYKGSSLRALKKLVGPYEVKAIRPREITYKKSGRFLLLGRDVVEKVLGKDYKIKDVRGRVFKEGNKTFMATLNIRSAFISDRNYNKIEEDFYKFFNFKTLPDIEIPHELITARDLFDIIKNSGPVIVYDLETSGLHPTRDWIICVAFYVPGYDKAFIVMWDDDQIEYMQNILDLDKTFVGHNLKFDMRMLAQNGVTTGDNYHDTMLMYYAIDERPGRSLKKLANKFCGAPQWDAELDVYKKKHKITSYADIPLEILLPYAVKDVYYNFLLYEEIKKKMTSDLWKFYRTQLRPFNEVAKQMWFHVDVDLIKDLTVEFSKEHDDIQDKLRQICDRPEFNPRSHKQVKEVLFEEFQITPIEFTDKGAPSANKSSLEHFVSVTQGKQNQFVRMLLQYRQVQKALKTYLANFDEMEHRGIIFPDVNVAGTVSGRFTMGVMGTLPKPYANPYVKPIRNLVVAGEDKLLVVIDYDQAELRVVAIESQEPAYLKVFKEGGDPHASTTDSLFGTGWRNSEEPSAYRSKGKTINFAVLYGAGPTTVAKNAGIPVKQAEQLLNRYWATYRHIHRWIVKIKKQALRENYVQAPLGQYRRFPFIHSNNSWKVKKEAPNFIIQSTANTLNGLAAVEISKNPDWRVCMTYHDSVIVEVPEHNAENHAKQIARVMQEVPAKVYSDIIPFTTEYEIGKSWGEAT